MSPCGASFSKARTTTTPTATLPTPARASVASLMRGPLHLPPRRRARAGVLATWSRLDLSRPDDRRSTSCATDATSDHRRRGCACRWGFGFRPAARCCRPQGLAGRVPSSRILACLASLADRFWSPSAVAVLQLSRLFRPTSRQYRSRSGRDPTWLGRTLRNAPAGCQQPETCCSG